MSSLSGTKFPLQLESPGLFEFNVHIRFCTVFPASVLAPPFFFFLASSLFFVFIYLLAHLAQQFKGHSHFICSSGVTLSPLIQYRCPLSYIMCVPVGSPSRCGDVMVYDVNINQSSFPTLFISVLVSISVCMALSTVFHSINSPNNSPLSHSVLVVLFLPY